MEQLLEGLAVATTGSSLLYIFLGTVVGILLGAMPGLGPTMGMAVALPFVIYMQPEQGIFLLVSMIVGANFGNSIPAVLIRIPGTAAAVLTVEEGHPFQQRGEGGLALAVCLTSSVIGQFLGLLVFGLGVIPLAQYAVRFLFPEFFALALFGLLAAASLLGENLRKGVAGVVFGLLLAVVGADSISSQERLTWDIPRLLSGIPQLPALIGLLALREVFAGVIDQAKRRRDTSPAQEAGADVRQLTQSFWKPPHLPFKTFRSTLGATGIGSLVGIILGALPGAGPAAATFVTYRATTTVHRWRRPPGEGSLPILGGIDASQNAAAATALIPTLALGIPGSVSMVIIMAALGAQGLVVGPGLQQSRPGLLQAVTGGLLVATVIMAIVGYLLISPSVYLTNLSQPVMVYITLVLVVAGTFALRWSMFDVWVAIILGLVGYGLMRFGIPIAPVALAFILGRMVEANFRRGLVMEGDLLGFISRPRTIVLLIIAFAVTAIDPVRSIIRYRRERHDVAVPS